MDKRVSLHQNKGFNFIELLTLENTFDFLIIRGTFPNLREIFTAVWRLKAGPRDGSQLLGAREKVKALLPGRT